MKDDIATAFGMALREFRLAKGYSQQELSAATNIGRSFLSEMETGRKVPTLLTLYRLANALNITATDFIKKVDTIRATSKSQNNKGTGKRPPHKSRF